MEFLTRIITVYDLDHLAYGISLVQNPMIKGMVLL